MSAHVLKNIKSFNCSLCFSSTSGKSSVTWQNILLHPCFLTHSKQNYRMCHLTKSNLQSGWVSSRLPLTYTVQWRGHNQVLHCLWRRLKSIHSPHSPTKGDNWTSDSDTNHTPVWPSEGGRYNVLSPHRTVDDHTHMLHRKEEILSGQTTVDIILTGTEQVEIIFCIYLTTLFPNE